MPVRAQGVGVQRQLAWLRVIGLADYRYTRLGGAALFEPADEAVGERRGGEHQGTDHHKRSAEAFQERRDKRDAMHDGVDMSNRSSVQGRCGRRCTERLVAPACGRRAWSSLGRPGGDSNWCMGGSMGCSNASCYRACDNSGPRRTPSPLVSFSYSSLGEGPRPSVLPVSPSNSGEGEQYVSCTVDQRAHHAHQGCENEPRPPMPGGQQDQSDDTQARGLAVELPPTAVYHQRVSLRRLPLARISHEHRSPLKKWSPL